MMAGEPGVELFEAIRTLRVAVREISRDAEQPFARREAPLGHLANVIRSLGQAKPVKPPLRSEEYALQWRALLAGMRQQLERRAVRYLCWEPGVATDQRFHDYLDRESIDLGARWLQGLVRSCHTRWSPELGTGLVTKRVRGRLESYQGPNRLALRWKNASTMMLGPRGHEEFAAYMIENLQPLKACCEEWGIDEQTRYVLEAVRQAVRHCHQAMGQSQAFGEYLLAELLPWSKWLPQDFKAVVGATILHPEVSEIRESLTSFVLRDDRLRDPRLPANATNWIGVPEEARLRFIQWLSRADIGFFFEHVLPDRSDPHGRKAFWLQYVSRMRMSRPLLNRNDEARLRTVIRQIREQVGHFGRLGGQTSAFLLDFGTLVVIEFSKVGAAYVYEKGVISEIAPDIWTSQPFREVELKQEDISVARIVHWKGRWEGRMAGILARYGIRPA